MVGVAELPVENTFVLTGGRGIVALASGKMSFFASTVTFGAFSSGSVFLCTISEGTRIASGRGVTGSASLGSGTRKCLIGAGVCGTGGGVLTSVTK